VDDDLVLRLAQDQADVIGHFDDARRFVEVTLDDAEEIVALGRGQLGHADHFAALGGDGSGGRLSHRARV
jgi:hypothetical protein